MTTQQTPRPPADASQSWDAIAEGYDEYVTPTHLWLAEEGLDRAGLTAGMRFLDVAAGTGALSLPAARRGAHVLATDHAPAMLRRLEARARNEGLTGIDVRVMDGHALELEDDTFDVTGSQFGVMLFPDMPLGVREMARVTRPGGRVLLTALGSPAQVEFIQFFVRAVRAVAPQFAMPTDPPPLPFQLQDRARLRQVLEAARLRDVRVDALTERMEFTSAAQLWGWLTNSNPLTGTLLASLKLTASQREAVRGALDALWRDRAGSTGRAVLITPVSIGIGTR